MDQENILSEIETKRRITAGGPRGLTKERATFSVRDVHRSSYSRICPVTTPEGPSIGLVSHMSIYARINSFGFLEAPYYRVISNIKLDTLLGKKAKEMLGMRLAVMHNLYFYNSFMEKIRTALDSGSFQAFYSEIIHKVSRRI